MGRRTDGAVAPVVDFLAAVRRSGAFELGIGTGRIACRSRSAECVCTASTCRPDMVAQLRRKPGGDGHPGRDGRLRDDDGRRARSRSSTSSSTRS